MTRLLYLLEILIFCCQNIDSQTGPCPFNVMCTCSYDIPGTPGQTLGRGSRYTDPAILPGHVPLPLIEVVCLRVPFGKIPELPSGMIEQMDIVNSGLETLNENDFGDTRINNLRLMNNRLKIIHKKVFKEMSHSLKFLDLSNNNLVTVPRPAFSYLATLEWLNMQGNKLAELHYQDWAELKDTLSTLILGHNDIDKVPTDVFRNFWRLLWLNLENNNILQLQDGVFPENIQVLNLDHNLFTRFPMEAIDSLKSLSWLMIRGNFFDRMPSEGFRSKKILDKLDLGENYIRFIPSNSFNGSLSVRDLYLDLNLISELQDRVFSDINPSRLYLSSNRIFNISDDAFVGGPERSIIMLDLDANKLNSIPKALNKLKALKYLYLSNNNISKVHKKSFKSFANNLEALSLSGNILTKIPGKALENCTFLNHLDLGNNKISKIQEDDFFNWGIRLTTLILRNNRIMSLPTRLFRNTPKLNELSLSFNRILNMADDTFIDVINSLEILELSFSYYQNTFPDSVFKPLTNLRWIALDNNNFKQISETGLYSFGKLTYYNMESNRLRKIPKNLFHQNVHKQLSDVRLGYNFITSLETHTFDNLVSLRTLVLVGNKINKIEIETFRMLPNLVTVLLAGNHIEKIPDRTFSDVPNLMELQLQRNYIKKFSLTALENCTSSLLPLSLNLSHNSITELLPYVGGNVFAKKVDVSHNMLKEVPTNFFESFTNTLQFLNMGYNRMNKLCSPQAFGILNNLHTLILHHNNIREMIQGVFKGTTAIQVLDMSYNLLEVLPHRCFGDIKSLRILDISRNHLRTLPKSVFNGTVIENLKISRNDFISMPMTALASIAGTLHYLDISYNRLEHLDSTMFNGFLKLIQLNLAHNKLTILPDNVFVSLISIIKLDLSENPVRANFKELFHYTQKIQYLNLAKIGFTAFPIIPLPNLIFLNISRNKLTDIEIQSILSLTNLRYLDVSHNNVHYVHSRPWGFMPYLKQLDMSYNPIKYLTRDSFMGLTRLETLVVKNLDKLTRFDYDTLSHMTFLRELYMNTFPNIEKYRFRVGHLLATVYTLEKLFLEIREDALTDQLSGAFGPKLKELHVYGKNLKAIDEKLFRGFTIQNELLLSITDTSIEFLPDGLLSHLHGVKSLSLDLRRNKLKHLSPHVLYKNGSLWQSIGTRFVAGGLALQGNSWICDCSLVWLGHWLRRWLRETLQIHTAVLSGAQKVYQLAREATCYDPIHERTIALLDMRQNDLNCKASPFSGGVAETPKLNFYYFSLISILPVLYNLMLSNLFFCQDNFFSFPR